MRRSRTGDWPVVIGPGPTVHFVYIFSFSSLVRVVANLRRCLHYHNIISRFRLALVQLRNHEVGYFDPLLWAVRVTIIVETFCIGGQI